MKTIWKFPLGLNRVQKIPMPANAEILTVQNQHNEAMLWAIVDPAKPIQERVFELIETGVEIFSVPEGTERAYINTFQKFAGNYIVHLFEIKRSN